MSRHQNHNMAISSPCSSCLICQEVDIQQAGQLSFTFWPGGFCSWSRFMAPVISRHQSLRASSFAQHKSHLGTPSPPHFKYAPPALPQFAQDKKGNIYTGFAWDDPPLPVSVFRALISTAGQAQAETCEGEARMLQAAWERQPLSPARLGGGTCRQEAEVPSSISAPPPSSCKREEAAREQGAAGVGKGAEPGARFAQSSLSSFLLLSPRLTRRGQR